jgi:transcriptional regulator with XRE-family HTH domain
LSNSNRFGDFVRSARKKKDYSIDSLAELSGLSNAQISRIERGVGGAPKVDTINKLAQGLEIAPTDLLAAAELLNDVAKASERIQHLTDLKSLYDQSVEKIADADKKIDIYGKEIEQLQRFVDNPTTDLATFIELPFITYFGKELSSNQRERIKKMLEILIEQQGEE